MNLALVSFLAYTAVLLAIGIWSYRIVEKVPIAKYEEEFYAAGRGLGGDRGGVDHRRRHGERGDLHRGARHVLRLRLLLGPHQRDPDLPQPDAAGGGRDHGRVWSPAGSTSSPTSTSSGPATGARPSCCCMAALVTLLLIPYMSTQFVGAARVIVQMTGMGYFASLALGSGVVLVYCVLGGMRGNSVATLLQGVVITVGTILLFVGTYKAAGGFESSTAAIAALDPKFLSPTMHGRVHVALHLFRRLSFRLLRRRFPPRDARRPELQEHDRPQTRDLDRSRSWSSSGPCCSASREPWAGPSSRTSRSPTRSRRGWR